MIKYEQLSNIFSSVGFPVSEYNIEDDDISLPYCAYVLSNDNQLSADGISYLSFLNVRLILVDSEISTTNQNKLENVLNTNGVFFTKEFDFDEEQRIYTTTYDFEVLK